MDRQRLLIVDDDLEMLRNVALMLSLEGYYVMTATSGMAASVLIKEHVFDVMITDLRMPIVDGYELVRRTQAIHPQTSIIVTTRYLDDDTKAWIARVGVLGLEKPYNVHQMSAILRDLTSTQLLRV